MNNGIAYGAVAGGATGYIKDEYKQYTGGNYHLYVAMLVSRGEEYWKIATLLSIRSAVAEAARLHAAELGPLVVVPVPANPPILQVNAAERLDDGAVRGLINWARITPAEWGDGGAANVGAFNPNNLPPNVARELRTPDMVLWATAMARMAYTVIAINGLGLITASHHLRGGAENAARRTLSLYDMAAPLRAVGATENDVVRFVFHDALHYLSYEAVANLVNLNLVGFAGKVANTVLKRLPAFPGGVVFVERAITCRRQVWGFAKYAAIRAAMDGQPKDNAIQALHGAVIATPLNYNSQFRPAQYAAALPAINNVIEYAIVLFALYDVMVPPTNNAANRGPTGGLGMKKLIDENMSTYQNAREQATGAIVAANAIVGLAPGYWAAVSN